MPYLRNRLHKKGLHLAVKGKKKIYSIQAQNYLLVDGYGIIHEMSEDPDTG